MKKAFVLVIFLVLLFCTGCSVSNSKFTIQELTNNTAAITGYEDKTVTTLEIPSKLNGKEVTQIGKDAFDRFRELSAITIPDTVTEIGDYAFIYCERLESIAFSQKLKSIGQYAFSGCKVQSVAMPEGVTYIGSSAFEGCEELTSVTLPSSLENIGTNPFASCNMLTSIEFPNGSRLFEVDNNVWYTKLYGRTLICYPAGLQDSSFDIPEGVVKIYNFAFQGCSLESITIPQSVKKIGAGAFCENQALTSIMIPDGVTSIEDFTFSNCKNLTSVIIPPSVTSISKNAFNLIESTVVLKVVSGSYAEQYAIDNNIAYSMTE